MTKFSDMPIGSRSGWLAWCKSHDWGQWEVAPPWYDDTTGEMVTYECVANAGFTQTFEESRHATPRALKAWAGY